MTGMRSRSRSALHFAAVALCGVLLFGVGTELVRSEGQNRDELIERFRLRSEIGARFLSSYVDDLLDRERIHAETSLDSPHISEERFSKVASILELPAAVLLDADGRLMAVEPPNPEIIGDEIASGYVHLRTALAGRVAVSDVVPRAADGAPVVAFAIPVSLPSGARVFSGARSIAETTIGSAYLRNVTPFIGARVYLVDETGATIASSLDGPQGPDQMQTRDHDFWVAIASGDEGRFDGSGGAERFAVTAVKGTPWRLAMSVPESVLLAPVSGVGRWITRSVFLALCLALAGVAALVHQLGKTRRREFATVEELSLTDALTGLSNRRGFELLGAQVLRSGARLGTMTAVLFLDVDGLKQVNDERGHDAGDQLLMKTADLLRDTFRDSDVIARLGGDEFCVVGVAPSSTGYRQALMSRFQANVDLQNADRGLSPELSLSLGVSWSDPRRPRSLDELVREADDRMFEEKRSRRAEAESNSPIPSIPEKVGSPPVSGG